MVQQGCLQFVIVAVNPKLYKTKQAKSHKMVTTECIDFSNTLLVFLELSRDRQTDRQTDRERERERERERGRVMSIKR